MSIESQQREYMNQHHKWNDKVRDFENKMQQANAEGRDGKSIYGYQLDEAKRQSRLCYELATDRGF